MKITATWTALFALGAASSLTGCPNPNTYGTPRTVAPGKLSHTVAVEGFGYKVKTTCSPQPCTAPQDSGSTPTLPTYQLRVGLGDRFDIGARVANMTSLGADFKWNFVKSQMFDAAIDPGFQFFKVTTSSVDANGNSVDASTNVVYLHGPFLLALNAGEAFSVVLTPGVTYGVISTSVNADKGIGVAQTTKGAMGRIGIGFDFRVFDSFALHPEVTFLQSFGSPSRLLYIYGLGFNFGHLPSYADQSETRAQPQQ